MAMSDEKVQEIANEVGKLNSEIKLREPRLKELKAMLMKEAEVRKKTKPWVITGTKFKVRVSIPKVTTVFSNMAALAEKVGIQAFLKMAKVNTGDVEDLLNGQEVDALSEQKEGNRSVTITAIKK